MKEKILGLPRNVFFLGLTSLFNDLSSEMVLSVFPAFFISVLKSGAASLGVVEGIAEAAANIIKVYSGGWSDRIKRRKIFAVVGYSLAVCVRPFYILVGSVGGVVGLRVLDRVGKGLRESPRDALISLSTPPAELGRAFGYHRAMDTIGGVLGPLAAYVILLAFPSGFNIVFITAFVVGLLAIASLVLVKDIAEVIETARSTERPERFPLSFKLYIAVVFVFSLGTLPVAVMLFKTQDLGIAIASIPLFYMIYSVSYALFSIPAGKLADSIGAARVIALGYIVLIIGYFVLIVTGTTLLLLLSFLIIGIFSALTDGVERSYVSQFVEAKYKATSYGWFNAASGFGALFAGIVGGYLWQRETPTIALLFAVATVVVGLLAFISISYKKLV